MRNMLVLTLSAVLLTATAAVVYWDNHLRQKSKASPMTKADAIQCFEYAESTKVKIEYKGKRRTAPEYVCLVWRKD